MSVISNDSRIGYIYRIRGYGLDYYGSTIQILNDRKYSHISDHRAWVKNDREGWICSSYYILDKGDDWNMECLETILTDINKTGIKEREQFWIENNECVNKFNAITSKEYKKEYQRLWAEKKRRERGVAKKERIKTADEKKYKREKQREYRAIMSEEKHQEVLDKKKLAYSNDKQREYLNRPEVKERNELKKQAVKLFKNLPFALV